MDSIELVDSEGYCSLCLSFNRGEESLQGCIFFFQFQYSQLCEKQLFASSSAG